MKKLIMVFALLGSQAVFSAERTVTLELIGMYCPMCPVTIRTALDMSDGVESVKVSRDPDHAIVKYDDTQTSPAKLVEVVVEAGYNAKILSK